MLANMANFTRIMLFLLLLFFWSCKIKYYIKIIYITQVVKYVIVNVMMIAMQLTLGKLCSCEFALNLCSKIGHALYSNCILFLVLKFKVQQIFCKSHSCVMGTRDPGWFVINTDLREWSKLRYWCAVVDSRILLLFNSADIFFKC